MYSILKKEYIKIIQNRFMMMVRLKQVYCVIIYESLLYQLFFNSNHNDKAISFY
jgi:hypothetical protein